MKKDAMSIMFLLICLPFLFISCETDNSKETETLIPCDLYRKYMLVDVQANFPIDLNFDGEGNTDLTKEIEAFKDCFIYVADEKLIIAWPEAQVGNYPSLTSEIPTVYTGQDIKYSIVQGHYTYTVNYWNNNTIAHVFPKEIGRRMPLNYFELQPPSMLEVDKEQNTISFNYPDALQNFMLKEGVKGRTLSAVFKPDSADNYIQ